GEFLRFLFLARLQGSFVPHMPSPLFDVLPYSRGVDLISEGIARGQVDALIELPAGRASLGRQIGRGFIARGPEHSRPCSTPENVELHPCVPSNTGFEFKKRASKQSGIYAAKPGNVRPEWLC